MEYALVSPENTIVEILPDTRCDPTVPTKAGWRWLPVENDPKPSPHPLQSVTSVNVVRNGSPVRSWQVTRHDAASVHVNAERDRRLKTFTFSGRVFDFDAESTVNIAGAGTLALAAIINGAKPGNLRWANPDRDFMWISADNFSVSMDAQTCFAFAQAAAQWKSGHIHAARLIKDMTKIPSDYAANARWPS